MFSRAASSFRAVRSRRHYYTRRATAPVAQPPAKGGPQWATATRKGLGARARSERRQRRTQRKDSCNGLPQHVSRKIDLGIGAHMGCHPPSGLNEVARGADTRRSSMEMLDAARPWPSRTVLAAMSVALLAALALAV